MQNIVTEGYRAAREGAIMYDEENQRMFLQEMMWHGSWRVDRTQKCINIDKSIQQSKAQS